MSLELEFRSALEKVLSDYEKSDKNLSEREAKDICHIRGLLQENENLVELHPLLSEYIKDDMTSKFYWFLPLVFDLKRELMRVVEKPEYNPGRYLRTNRALSRSNSTASLSSSYSFILSEMDNSLPSNLDARFSQLENEVKMVKESNNYLKINTEEIKKGFTVLQQDYNKIKAEIEILRTRALKAEAEVERLGLVIVQKDDQITKLQKENSELLNKLNIQKPASDSRVSSVVSPALFIRTTP